MKPQHASNEDLPQVALGCCARVGAGMPVWAPRRNARCELTPAYFPSFTIRGQLVVLPLCGTHNRKLEQSADAARLAAEWRP